MNDHLISAFGRELTASQWATVPYAKATEQTIRARLAMGWPAEKAIKTPDEKNLQAGYKGVSWHVSRKKYIAQIKIDGKVRFLGAVDDPEEAARLYDEAARPLGRVTNF